LFLIFLFLYDCFGIYFIFFYIYYIVAREACDEDNKKIKENLLQEANQEGSRRAMLSLSLSVLVSLCNKSGRREKASSFISLGIAD
jgi:hypothetical protein